MSRCDGCGGEDCVCCEVFIEQQADQRYQMEQPYDGSEFYESVRYEYGSMDEDEDELMVGERYFEDGRY